MYAELHCKTNFSFLEGASHADELVGRAAELGYVALAVTDRNSLAGVVRAHAAAKRANLKLIVGAEITPADAPSVVLWATDRAAYGQLSRLITRGRRQAPKGECCLRLDDIAEHAAGLLAGVADLRIQRPMTDDRSLKTEDRGSTRYLIPTIHYPLLAAYHDIFADRCYLLAELNRGIDDRGHLDHFIHLSEKTRIPLVAAGDVYYHAPDRMPLHDVLTATRHGTTVTAAGGLLFPNAQRHLKPLEQIAGAFSRAPSALQRTVEIADRCTFSLDELRYEYPEELAPSGMSAFQHLSTLAWRGAHKRYPRGIPDKVCRLLEHELHLIEELHYEAYFLTVWDVVRFARGRGVLCQGRGSAANSAVCYCLGITAVDPDYMDVLFERFISHERDEAPDIDVDFEHERREEVLQYIYEKYGRQRAGMTAEVICYRPRSAIRDVGKALGLSLDRVDALAKNLEGYQHEVNLPERCRQIGIDPDSETGRRLVCLVEQLIGFPRHLSQHVGGMVMTQGPLCELVPIENAAMEGRTVIQWDKNDLEELGILKVDCLALGMLTAIHKCFDLVVRHTGRQLTLTNIPAGDDRVYDMICRADTMGVFQIESRAQMSMLPRLKPRCYYDLVIEVAIVRPGPIQGNMVHPYLRRRSGREAVTYPNEAIRRVLKKTLGVPIFQEQAMRLAVVAAGFTPGEADQLRRAMGSWRRPGIIDQFRKKLLEGMRARGISSQFAGEIFRQIRGFGEYGFPESHAASFALLVYVSAWLKYYYPAAFTAATLNSQPMGFYAPAQLIRDARAHDVEMLPIDVNHSEWDCTLEELQQPEGTLDCGLQIGEGVCESRVPGTEISSDAPLPNPQSPSPHSPSAAHNSSAIRLGFRFILGLSAVFAKTIVQSRSGRPFHSVADLTRRTRFGRATVMRLARADTFQSVDCDRRTALWDALDQQFQARAMPLFDKLNLDEAPTEDFPSTEAEEEVFSDYQSIGLSLRDHPLSFYRNSLEKLKVNQADQLPQLANHQRVSIAGIVLLRQRPGTAKGITFVTLEDETGIANLVVHQNIWRRYHAITRHAPAWIAYGHIECQEGVIHVVVHRVESLPRQLRELNTRSRDFR